MTLIELMWFIVLSVAILVAAMAFILSGFHQQNTVVSRTAAVRTAEAGLEQLLRDLREAITGVSASASSTTTTISTYLPTPGNDTTGQPVTWTCTDSTLSTIGTCTRALNGTTKTLITGVQSVTLAPVSSSGATLALPLSAAANVAYIGITLQVQIVSQDHPNSPANHNGISDVPASLGPITLQAGTDLRNFS